MVKGGWIINVEALGLCGSVTCYVKMEINGVIHEHRMPHAIGPQIHIQRLYACGSPSLDDGTVVCDYLLPLNKISDVAI